MAKKNATVTKKERITEQTALWSWRIIVPMLVAGLLFFIANSAMWVNSVLFNTEKFTETTTTALLSESSRQSIASAVVDKALVDRPIAQRVVGQPATKLIAGLLDTNLAQTATEKVVTRLQTAVTTENPQNIELDLSGVKNIAAQLLTIAETADIEVQKPQQKLPDTIVLFDASSVPNLYSYGQIFLWLAPLASLSAVLLFAFPHIKNRKLVKRIMVLQGVTLLLFGFLALSVGPLFRPQILGQVSSPDARVVVENIYNAFIATFNQQSQLLLFVGMILIIIPATLWLYERQIKPLVLKRKH